MNEVKTIHLSRQQFTIAVDAHRLLRGYLDEINHQVKPKDDEVLKEIELRMAELLLERGVTQDKVILPEDVAFLKEQLGDPRNFKDDEDDEKDRPAEEQSAEKKLYRDTGHGMLAGVAAGLASYIGIDVLVVRLLFVLFTLASGTGIIVYILLWILVPEAKTSSDRLKMRGKAVTVDSIKQAIGRADIPGAASRASHVGSRVIERIVYMVLAIIGTVIVVASAALFTATVAIGTYTFTHGVLIGPEVAFPINGTHKGALVAAIAMLLSLAFMILAAGLTMIRRKAVVKGWIIASVAGLFAATAGLTGALGLKIVPEIAQKYRDMHQTQAYQLQPFSSATLTGEDARFKYQQSDTYFVEVRYFGDKQKAEVIKKEVTGGALVVDTTAYDEAFKKNCNIFCINDGDNVTVTIHAPSLDKIRVDAVRGESFFMIDESFKASQFELTTVGRVYTDISRVTASASKLDLANRNERLITLTGVNAGDNAQSILYANEDLVHLYKPGAVSLLLGDRTCEEGSDFIAIGSATSVVLNGQPLSAQELITKYTENSPSVYNCVRIL